MSSNQPVAAVFSMSSALMMTLACPMTQTPPHTSSSTNHILCWCEDEEVDEDTYLSAEHMRHREYYLTG